MQDIPRSETISTKQQRIATLAQEAPGRAFTSLNHYLDLEWLREAYRRTRKDGAAGVDGMTAEVYAEHLEANLQDLLDRAKSGRYLAPAVRRVHIPKGDGRKTRPIGIPAFEDKVLQRAVAMILEPIYEQDFLDCSYGFRPRRSAHQALEALRKQHDRFKCRWILEVDIKAFFDDLDQAHLRTFLRRRVQDGVLLRLIGKWLNAGVLDRGELSFPEAGTPQGGVISPLLANIYLHEVLDDWFEREVKPRLSGPAYIVRYADDFVVGLANRDDARRVWAVLPKRFGKYGLTLHPEKTRLVPFQRPPVRPGFPGSRPVQPPGTFDMLGFTHFWAKARKGIWVIKRKTAKDRFTRAIKRITDWCRAHRHWSITEQHRALCQMLKGHYAYFGITGNAWSLKRLQHEVMWIWRKWLGRRSQRNFMSQERFFQILERFPLPPPIAVHSTLRLEAKP